MKNIPHKSHISNKLGCSTFLPKKEEKEEKEEKEKKETKDKKEEKEKRRKHRKNCETALECLN